jgi:hypothetical protein
MLISAMIAEIINLATDKTQINTDINFISVGIYDCGGSWQVWLQFGKSGYLSKVKDVCLDQEVYFEAKTLVKALKLLKNNVISCKEIFI